MAKANYELKLNNKQVVSSKNYTEHITYMLDVDNTDEGKKVLSTGSSTNLPEISDFKSICIVNESKIPIELQIALVAYKDNTDWDDVNSVDQGPDSATIYRYINQLLLAGDFYILNGSRIVSYAEQHSAANDSVLDNHVPTAARSLDSGFVIDNTTATNNIVGSASNTLVYLDGWTSATVNDANAFHVGDLIKIDNEVMEVTAIGTRAAKASNTLTVKRGQYGTTAQASHGDGDTVEFAFFNTYYSENKFSTPRTDASGKFHAFNYFVYGRTTDLTSSGIVPGSVAIKFYTPGYQELGLSGITAGTDTGLVAGRQYYFKIEVDGGAAVELDVTIDASNTNFGGKNGLVQKIQEAMNAKYSVAGGLFEKRVSVGIVDGDLRFTSQQYLSGSAIALTAGTTGSDANYNFFAQANGRIPIASGLNAAVPGVLPPDTVNQRADNVTINNDSAFMFDNGMGDLLGAGRGKINYETGEIDFQSFPNADFVVNAAYHSALSGGLRTTDTGKNTVHEIYARSVNNKIKGKIKVDIYK